MNRVRTIPVKAILPIDGQIQLVCAEDIEHSSGDSANESNVDLRNS
jgi:hypothetical protein